MRSGPVQRQMQNHVAGGHFSAPDAQWRGVCNYQYQSVASLVDDMLLILCYIVTAYQTALEE